MRKKRCENIQRIGCCYADPNCRVRKVGQKQQSKPISKILRRDPERMQWMSYTSWLQIYNHCSTCCTASDQPKVGQGALKALEIVEGSLRRNPEHYEWECDKANRGSKTCGESRQ